MTTPPLGERLARRARNDCALVRDAAESAVRAAASVAAAAALATALASPVLADVPETAPTSALFDDAGVVQKANASLFSKAVENIQLTEGYTVRFVIAKGMPYGLSPDDYAAELFSQWGLGERDVLFVASPRLARAGAAVGDATGQRLTKDIAESICNETYALRSGEELYGNALLDVSNRLIPVLGGKEDPGPPDLTSREAMKSYKTKKETSSERGKYTKIVGAVLVIAFVAPLVQTYWFVKDD